MSIDQVVRFWSVDTPGGQIMLVECKHPDSPQEHPDVPLEMLCETHHRSTYYCDDLGAVWCDGGHGKQFHHLEVK